MQPHTHVAVPVATVAAGVRYGPGGQEGLGLPAWKYKDTQAFKRQHPQISAGENENKNKKSPSQVRYDGPHLLNQHLADRRGRILCSRPTRVTQ